MNRKYPMKKQKGFTLIELSAGIIIILLTVVGIMRNVNKNVEASEDKRVMDEVGEIISAANEWKGLNPTFAGISIAQLTALENLDERFGNGDNVNPYGLDYTVTVNPANPRFFNIVVQTLDNVHCQRMARKAAPITVDGAGSSCAGANLTLISGV